ncbi:MAG: cation diffusion facilitator family transporter [Tepidisphaeraceae bacterium]
MLLSWQRIPTAEKVAIGLSVSVGVTLLVVKFIAYFITGSAAIFSDAVESVVNVLASGVALWSLALAHTPPDEKHPYGHGKVEFISAAFEGGMILLAAVFILVQTVIQIVNRQVGPEDVEIGLWLMILAMLVNGGIGLALVRVGRRQGSLTLEADGLHLLTDAVTSIAVVAALVVVKLTGWKWADPITAVGISIYIAVAGLKMAARSFAGLMDEQDSGDEKQLVAILDSHVNLAGPTPRICSYHKLRHRHSGRYHWVDFHIMVPSRLSVAEGHKIASAIEWEIEKTLGSGNATAHVEPCATPNCPTCDAELSASTS